mgnify:CR=1 FL=1
MKNLLKKTMLLSLTALSIGVNAQQNETIITGKIVSNQQPLESVMVSILNAKDSSKVKTFNSSTASFKAARFPVKVAAVLSSVKSVTKAFGLWTLKEAIATNVCSQKKSLGELVNTNKYFITYTQKPVFLFASKYGKALGIDGK